MTETSVNEGDYARLAIMLYSFMYLFIYLFSQMQQLDQGLLRPLGDRTHFRYEDVLMFSTTVSPSGLDESRTLSDCSIFKLIVPHPGLAVFISVGSESRNSFSLEGERGECRGVANVIASLFNAADACY